MPTTTATTYELLAVTDKWCSKWHLGAVQKGNVTFCGVKLAMPGKGKPAVSDEDADGTNRYKISTDLGEVGCGACQRGPAWKNRDGSAYTEPAKKATGTRRAPVTSAPPPATEASPPDHTSVIDKDPETGLPRIRPEVQDKVDNIVAEQLARTDIDAAMAAAEEADKQPEPAAPAKPRARKPRARKAAAK
jgi:hypothetical protein